MKRLTTFMILMAFGLVLDRAFNHGAVTVRLAGDFDEAKAWTMQSSGKVARSLYGFGGG